MKRRIGSEVVHGTDGVDPGTGAISPPIYQTSTFAFKSAEQGAAIFAGTEDGYVYTRISNPTNDRLAKKMARLEGAEAGLVFASGLAAIAACVITLTKKGESFIADDTIYGGTHAMFKDVIPRFGITPIRADCSDINNTKKALNESVKWIFIETPANPTMKVIDIEAHAKLAAKSGVPLVVDNTFATPFFQRPIELGADVVMHSATKYISGHGDVVGGIVVGKKDFVHKMRESALSHMGACMSPFNAWLLLRGLKTLGVRMERHAYNAQRISEFLSTHPKISRVYYPGLSTDPFYDLAKKQMSGMGGMIAFEMKGGLKAGANLVNSVRLCTLAVSLGECDTLIEHPASMTHSTLSEEERMAVGITEGLVRVSVGIEDVNDLIEDLKEALEKA
ncbi:aminotransferase class I/II-fold pyridoxal phosphate-dependent enzyme [candidate division TA06 bacterium]|uniref:Aminotransferase class I/II-fold pyridoxal phosphate-dependent enzyme n=1 Tax=candidate division TA06 bacterium TaxID=2250710 RepID=A0A523UYF0_UNCT6|nr:MAG: aminotransferase class I/II-fold pyridoxal phosphate-dependent enzyme [candidate division TA06 bacterium]